MSIVAWSVDCGLQTTSRTRLITSTLMAARGLSRSGLRYALRQAVSAPSVISTPYGGAVRFNAGLIPPPDETSVGDVYAGLTCVDPARMSDRGI
jgi:hypothetical protein